MLVESSFIADVSISSVQPTPRVIVSSNGADYVFNPHYKLATSDARSRDAERVFRESANSSMVRVVRVIKAGL